MREGDILTVVGGGLAGCEAAWQAARRGVRVRILEMRPGRMTGAHRTRDLAELVCSNSFGSRLPDRASGILMEELRRCGSFLLRCAEACAVPAGAALAVDRRQFAQAAAAAIESDPAIEVVRAEAPAIPPPPAILAAGPLASPSFAAALAALTGEPNLFFYDAIAPVIEADSVDRTVVFAASRYGRGDAPEGDYLNCPFTDEEYDRFVDALMSAERIELAPFETAIQGGVRAGPGLFFEGCLPIEVLAARGRDALAFGPLRPVGLRDPRTGRRSRAVLQLRREDAAGELLNLVGCQTNLRHSEQERVFRLVPGLAAARFARYGQMHRNTYVHSPRVLRPTMEMRAADGVWIAGQLAGAEGYLGALATGLVAGVAAARRMTGLPDATWPASTMIGALAQALAGGPPDVFQPVKAHLGLLPPLPDPPRGRRERAARLAERARHDLEQFLREIGHPA